MCLSEERKSSSDHADPNQDDLPDKTVITVDDRSLTSHLGRNGAGNRSGNPSRRIILLLAAAAELVPDRHSALAMPGNTAAGVS